MAILTVNKEIIKSMVLSESVDTASNTLLEQELQEALDIQTIERQKMSVTPENIRLFTHEGNYLVEYSEIRKMAEDNQVSDLEALEAVAEYYKDEADITAQNFFVVIESDQFFIDILSEAKNGNEEKKIQIKESINGLKELKSKGVQFMKKI